MTPGSASPCEIHVGTCGYAFREWSRCGIYPADAPSDRLLTLYGRQLTVTEVGHTWYRMPQADELCQLEAQRPPHLRLTLRLSRELTREPEPDGWRQQVERLRQALQPLQAGGALLALLLTFEQGFDRSPRHRAWLATLLDALQGLPLALELRCATWAQPKVFAELERRGVSLVAVDWPELPNLFPPLELVTNPELLYVRFHGRHTRAWYAPGGGVQQDYSYSEAELAGWIDERLALMLPRCRRAVLLFDNHVRGQSVRDALTLRRLLQQRGHRVALPP